jgi:hypothetical protein
MLCVWGGGGGLDGVPGLVEEDVAGLGGLLNVGGEAVEIFNGGRICAVG